MIDLEDRLRQALSAEAGRAQPGMLRSLRPPRAPAARGWLAVRARPARRWPGWVAPLAAAAAVIAVVAGTVAVSGAIHGRRAAGGAGLARRVIAYVAGAGLGTVTPIRTATNTALPPVNAGGNPDFIAITPDGTTAYVANYVYQLGTVTPIRTATSTALSPIKTGRSPAAIAITPDGTTAYVANFDSGTVTPIRTATNTALPPIKVGRDPVNIVITPNGRTAYVVNNGSGTVTPIRTATNTALPPVMAGPHPDAIAMTPDGTTIYVANDVHAGTVTPIRTATSTALPPIKTGDPTAIAITPDGTTAYVTNYFLGTVTPIRTATNTALPPIKVGRGGGVIAIPPYQRPASRPARNAIGHARSPTSSATRVKTLRASVHSQKGRTPGTFTFTISGPDAADAVAFDYALDTTLGGGGTFPGFGNAFVPVGPGGTATTPTLIPTRPGPNFLTVDTVDRAGNISQPVTYDFVLTSPPPDARGDLDGDHIPGLVATTKAGTLQIYFGKGNGMLRAKTVFADSGTGWRRAKIAQNGNFTGGPYQDLLAIQHGLLLVYPNNGLGDFNALGLTEEFRPNGGTWSGVSQLIAPGDITGDGITDLVVRNGSGDLFIYPGDGQRTFGDSTTRLHVGTGFTTAKYPLITTIGDANGDGVPDLYATTAGALVFIPGIHGGGFGTPVPVPGTRTDWQDVTGIG
jgi:YVTN family beta-propeller protein